MLDGQDHLPGRIGSDGGFSSLSNREREASETREAPLPLPRLQDVASHKQGDVGWWGSLGGISVVEELLQGIVVDLIGLLCYAMLPDGKFCQADTHSIVHFKRGIEDDGRRYGGEWVGYCEGCLDRLFGHRLWHEGHDVVPIHEAVARRRAELS